MACGSLVSTDEDVSVELRHQATVVLWRVRPSYL